MTSAASRGILDASRELCRRDLSESSCASVPTRVRHKPWLTGKPAKVEMSEAAVAEATTLCPIPQLITPPYTVGALTQEPVINSLGSPHPRSAFRRGRRTTIAAVQSGRRRTAKHQLLYEYRCHR